MGVNTAETVAKNILTLIIGSSTAKVIGVLTIPIITRLYTPSDIGGLSMFIAIVSILIPLSTLRYSVAIPLPKEANRGIAVFQLCIVISCILLILLYFLIIMFEATLLELFGESFSSSLLFIIPLAVFGAGIYEAFESYATRTGEFKLIAKTKVSQSILGNITKVGMGLAGFGIIGLVSGYVITLGGGIGVFLRQYIHNVGYALINKTEYISVFTEYISFPIYRLPSQFLLILSGKAPLLFFGMYFSSNDAGQLGLSLMCLAFPISLIATSAGQAFYSEVAKLGVEKTAEILSLTIMTLKNMLLLGLLPTLILLFFSEKIFVIIFGEQWRVAGIYTQILSIYILFQFISTPLINVLNIYLKQNSFLYLNILKVSLVFSVFFISMLFDFSATKSLYIYSFAMSLNYILIIIFVIFVIKHFKKD